MPRDAAENLIREKKGNCAFVAISGPRSSVDGWPNVWYYASP